MTFQPNREELAWAAGFFDGEGHTGSNVQRSNKTGYKYPAICIAQSDTTEELVRFNKAVNSLGKVYGPYGPYSTQKKPYYLLNITGFEKVQAVIAMLWPFLSSTKKEQAEKALDEYHEHFREEK